MRVSKSILSQYLRTSCQRALYLTLQSSEDLSQKGLPLPLDARPSARFLRDAGIELERQTFNRLEKAFGVERVIGKKQNTVGGWGDLSLKKGLSRIGNEPAFLVHPSYSLKAIREIFLRNIGVKADDTALIPQLAKFVPDILAVGRLRPHDLQEVLPTGERRAIHEEDTRVPLSVVDIKHAQEANTSYEAEVALYAITLSNWLECNKLSSDFYVTSDIFLWTSGGIEDGRFSEMCVDPSVSIEQRLCALVMELSPINAPIYLQAIRRFFSEDLPTIIEIGMSNFEGLDWHVGSRCSSCDWLGHREWLAARDVMKLEENPDSYCFSKAEQNDQLSRVPIITRGARRILEKEGITQVRKLDKVDGEEEIFRKHTTLKSERRSLPATARAINTGEISIDQNRTDGGLAKYADLDVFLSVNFDSGAGQLTGIGIFVNFRQHTKFGERADVTKTWQQQFVVTGKTFESERVTVLAFLNYLAKIYTHVQDPSSEKGGEHADKTEAQLIFWDQRQYEELCLAVGRHITAILYSNEERTVRALVWLFPPEEIQELDTLDGRKPGAVFVQDIVRRLVHVPALHELTLFNVVEHYHWGEEQAQIPRPFYREPFTDAIPRERIYEIWTGTASSGTFTVKWGDTIKDQSQLVADFQKAIGAQSRALMHVVWRLRRDLGQRLKARAPRLDLKVPRWGQGVAYDAKLWQAWSAFSKAFDEVMAYRTFLSEPEEVEATFEGMRLENLIEVTNDKMTFRVAPDSAYTKIKPNDGFLCLSVDAIPGFLGLRVKDVITVDDLPPEFRDEKSGSRFLHKLFRIKLVFLDRSKLIATVVWNNWGQPEKNLRAAIFTQLGELALKNLTVVPSTVPNFQGNRLNKVLRTIGNPSIAVPTEETLSALGLSGIIVRPGESPITPAAEVLWKADELSIQTTRLPQDAALIAEWATESADLNESQQGAIEHALTHRLSIIWGPPGTGKTQACASLVHQLANFEGTRKDGSPYGILVTGPNYKAVGELAERVAGNLAKDKSAECKCYFIYSKNRDDKFKRPEASDGNFEVIETYADIHEDSFIEMINRLQHGDNVTIVAAVAHQCPRIAEQCGETTNSSALLPIFDFALIDESSQLSMDIAIPVLALLKSECQIAFAGDLLQMPPITRCDPPGGAEYLIGSVQNYFVKRFNIEEQRLLINYRSCNEIVSYIKCLGYPDEMSSKFPETRLSFIGDIGEQGDIPQNPNQINSEAWQTVLDPNHPIVAVTYPDGVSGQANQFEAECVVSIVILLRHVVSATLRGQNDVETNAVHTDESFWNVGIGIVTPHRAQRAIIVQKLLDAFPEVCPNLIEDAVDTVERFQGGQRHTIIVSFGVGDPDIIVGEERFLMQLERTNVAISRAMAKCILFMSDDIVAHIPADRKAIDTAHALKGVVDEWCNNATSYEIDDGESGTRKVIVRTRQN